MNSAHVGSTTKRSAGMIDTRQHETKARCAAPRPTSRLLRSDVLKISMDNSTFEGNGDQSSYQVGKHTPQLLPHDGDFRIFHLDDKNLPITPCKLLVFVSVATKANIIPRRNQFPHRIEASAGGPRGRGGSVVKNFRMAWYFLSWKKNNY